MSGRGAGRAGRGGRGGHAPAPAQPSPQVSHAVNVANAAVGQSPQAEHPEIQPAHDVDMDNHVDANVEMQEHEQPAQVHPVQQAQVDAPPAWVLTLIQAMQASQQTLMDSRISALEARLTAQNQALNKLDETLLRQLSSIAMFTGAGERPWDDFEQEFRNKAAQIPSLPKTEWVRYMHFRISDRALEHAKIQGLVSTDNQLLCTDFEEYCSKMTEAMFGDSLSKTAKIQTLATLQQTGKYSNALDFLRAKEKLLNQIPTEDMAGYIRASLTLLGMDQVLVQAISPNPTSADGLFHSYADVRKQVVAVLGVNQQLFSAAAHNLSTQQHKSSTNAWQKSYKGNNSSYQTSDKQHSQQGHKRQGAANSSHQPSADKQQQAQPASTSSDKPAAKKPNPYENSVCSDCGKKGHTSLNYYKCEKNPRNISKAK
jgi:hypothetical protein